MRDAARQELRARTGVLSGASSTPAAWVAAFNESLAATEQLAAAAAASSAAAWRWPPPECAGREGTLPADWHDPAVQASTRQALRNLRLPVFPRLGADEGAHLRLRGGIYASDADAFSTADSLMLLLFEDQHLLGW